jgi:hypothetical protein
VCVSVCVYVIGAGDELADAPLEAASLHSFGEGACLCGGAAFEGACVCVCVCDECCVCVYIYLYVGDNLYIYIK